MRVAAEKFVVGNSHVDKGERSSRSVGRVKAIELFPLFFLVVLLVAGRGKLWMISILSVRRTGKRMTRGASLWNGCEVL